MDKGTETGIVATILAYLCSRQPNLTDEEATERIIYGPSTSNQIERWWKELHERLEKYYKPSLSHYNPNNIRDREMVAYILIPIIQIDLFKDVVWNTHRIREQKDRDLQSGVPNHIFAFNSYCLKTYSSGVLSLVRHVAGPTLRKPGFSN